MSWYCWISSKIQLTGISFFYECFYYYDILCSLTTMLVCMSSALYPEASQAVIFLPLMQWLVTNKELCLIGEMNQNARYIFFINSFLTFVYIIWFYISRSPVQLEVNGLNVQIHVKLPVEQFMMKSLVLSNVCLGVHAQWASYLIILAYVLM